MREDDPAKERVIRALDSVTQLPGFENLLVGKPMPFSTALHLALLVDSLNSGNYVPVWRQDVVNAVLKFQEDVATARLHYKHTGESLPHYERFARQLSGSGSDTAEAIRNRHAFFLAKLCSAIRIQARDEERCFGALEKEVIWNRDRGQCKRPGCPQPRIPFREATIHHVIEHSAGGGTTLENGVLICRGCHADRAEMQRLTAHFQDYIRRVNASRSQLMTGEVIAGGRREETPEDTVTENGPDGNVAPAPGEKLKIVIHWRALGVDRDDQTIRKDQSSDSIVKFIVEIIDAFGKPMEQQLTVLPVIRYALSRNPATAFLNPSTGVPFSSTPVPRTDLHFCPHSGTPEKVKRLTTLVSRLALPDGRDFPEGSVEFSIE